jgi:hypothetical protein
MLYEKNNEDFINNNIENGKIELIDEMTNSVYKYNSKLKMSGRIGVELIPTFLYDKTIILHICTNGLEDSDDFNRSLYVLNKMSILCKINMKAECKDRVLVFGSMIPLYQYVQIYGESGNALNEIMTNGIYGNGKMVYISPLTYYDCGISRLRGIYSITSYIKNAKILYVLELVKDKINWTNIVELRKDLDKKIRDILEYERFMLGYEFSSYYEKHLFNDTNDIYTNDLIEVLKLKVMYDIINNDSLTNEWIEQYKVKTNIYLDRERLYKDFVELEDNILNNCKIGSPNVYYKYTPYLINTMHANTKTIKKVYDLIDSGESTIDHMIDRNEFMENNKSNYFSEYEHGIERNVFVTVNSKYSDLINDIIFRTDNMETEE